MPGFDPMNCAEFECRLTALAAGEGSGDPRAAELAHLWRHAAECGGCRGAAGLLDFLALPPAERSPVADPGANYWDTFGARLAARIAEADADAAPPVVRRGFGFRRVAAVAALALLTGALWFGLRARREAPELTWLIAENMTEEFGEAPSDLTDDLAALLEGHSGDRAAEALAGLVGSAGSLGHDGLDFGEDPLDAADPAVDFDALLNGVDRWEQVAGLAAWLPEDGAESLAVEAGLPGTLSHGVRPLPDPSGLGAEARKEFVRWISEQLRPETDRS